VISKKSVQRFYQTSPGKVDRYKPEAIAPLCHRTEKASSGAAKKIESALHKLGKELLTIQL
jgi:hypothetical protein